MVQMGLLISDGILALGLRHVFEACRMGCAGSEKRLTFGTTALGEFVGRLHQWCEPTHRSERTHPNRQSWLSDPTGTAAFLQQAYDASDRHLAGF